MMDFSMGAGKATGSDLIPNGQLAWAILNVRGVKSAQSGGQYIDAELTIDDGQPHARRKVWEMIGDPNHPGNSEAYREMGMVAISRILEAGRGAGPNNPAGYKIDNYGQLSGLRVPIKIGIQKGKNGYDDKNRVAEWLTPNPASQSGYKDFELLQSGVFNKADKNKQAAAPQTSFGFGGTGAPAQQANGAFGSQPQTHQTPSANTAFQNPQQTGEGAASAADQQNSTGFAPTSDATEPSRSDQPSWLQQANGQ